MTETEHHIDTLYFFLRMKTLQSASECPVYTWKEISLPNVAKVFVKKKRELARYIGLEFKQPTVFLCGTLTLNVIFAQCHA